MAIRDIDRAVDPRIGRGCLSSQYWGIGPPIDCATGSRTSRASRKQTPMSSVVASLKSGHDAHKLRP